MLLYPGLVPLLFVTIHCSIFLNHTHGNLILHCLLSASLEWKLLENVVLFSTLFLFIFERLSLMLKVLKMSLLYF